MFNVRVLQASYGDCLILEYGTEAAPRYALVDGGPRGVFRRTLKQELEWVADQGGKLDFVAISHVDTDHVSGILDFMAELEAADANGVPRLVDVDAVWHNSFAKALGDGSLSLQNRFADLMNSHPDPAFAAAADHDFQGIAQGNKLRILAAQLSIPINVGFPNDLITVETAPVVQLDNMTLRIVGPTQANLDALKVEWDEWITHNEDVAASFDNSLLGNEDTSEPNLSSLMFLVEAEGKTALFTGDGRSDHLLDGLGMAGFLDAAGRMHVDVLKVMHHGSDRNVTKTFFKTVTADTYVISANGHPDNPDLSTMIWMVEAAKEQGRQIKIICTNARSTTRKLVEEYDPDEYGYELEIMPRHHRYRRIELAG